MTADQLLKQITSRVVHIHAKRREAVDLLMDRPVGMPQSYRERVSLRMLERSVVHWQFLVPTTAIERARLIYAFAEIYPLDTGLYPQTASALGVFDEGVREAHQTLFSSTIEEKLARSTNAAFAAQSAEHADSAAADLLEALEWRFLKRGDVLYQQGDESDALYSIVDGRLRVTTREKDRSTISVEAYQGEIVGEEAIVSGAKRAATVVAVRDCELVYLTPTSYEQLTMKYPRGMTRLGMQLVQRMQRIAGVEPPHKSGKSIVILPASHDMGDFARRLVDALGNALYLHPDHLDGLMPEHMLDDLEAHVRDYDFDDWVRVLASNHAFLVFEGTTDSPNWTQRAIEQADRILVVGRAADSPDLSPVEHFLGQVPQPELLAPQEFVLLHAHRQNEGYNTVPWLEKRNIARHHHVALDDDAGLQRVARFLRGKAVGFVFGGGGMRAAAHIGAIKALHEAGYYADVVGGTSSGSIMAAMYAMGWDVETITELARERLLKRSVIVNLTVPVVSISSAHQMSKAFQSIFADTHMEDLWTTCFTISANMTQTRQSVNKTGLLRHAVRYSTSIAGMFPPAPDEHGNIHIDGGVVNNTPADVMRDFIDSGVNIAVDLGFTEREKIHYDYGEHLSGAYVLWRRLNPFADPLRVPNILSILMRSNAISSINITHEQVAHADVIIRPAVAGYGLFDFDKFDALFDLGYKAGQKAIVSFDRGE